MSTLGDLYRQARALHDERTAQAMQDPRPTYQLLREIDELKKIMTGLLQAYKDAGGAQAPKEGDYRGNHHGVDRSGSTRSAGSDRVDLTG